MSPAPRQPVVFSPKFTSAAALTLVVLLAGCATGTRTPAEPVSNGMSAAGGEDSGAVAALAFYQTLQRMTGTQIGRERQALATMPATPANQMRTAMVLGHPRGQYDLPKALSLLDGILKATDAAAVALHPLARLLADSYGERLRLDLQLDKQGQQLKESQRKAIELQEKIDGLADIERSLPQRPRISRPGTGAGS